MTGSHTRRSSRQRYRAFVEKYQQRKLDELIEAGSSPKSAEEKKPADSPKRREYLREYLRWLWPHRVAFSVVVVLSLSVAGLEMIQPLFMRFIVDRVLLVPDLAAATRGRLLHTAGLTFLVVIVVESLLTGLRDYRQRLLNTRVMLSLRRSLYDRFLHLPLPKLWDMKTGGILSRLTGDVETTTGLLQLAVVSPTISAIRLLIAIVILTSLNWRLSLMALAIIPGIMILSFTQARRVRPIYRSLRKDAEQIDGRVGETFSGIRVVRAFGRELRELVEYLRGRHMVLRKEMFAQRREMVLWSSWGLLLGIVNVVIVWYGGYLNLRGRASVGDIMAFQWYTF